MRSWWRRLREPNIERLSFEEREQLIAALARLNREEPIPLQRDPRTIIVAERYDRALVWCRDNNVNPRARTTVIATTPERLSGLSVSYDDTVIRCPGYARIPGLAEALKMAELVGGVA